MKSLKQALLAGRTALYRQGMRIVGRVMPIKGEQVLFTSFGGHAYSDNPRAVSEALHAQLPKARVIWLFQDAKKARPAMPDYVIPLRIHGLRALYAMATSGAWVLNGLMPPYAVKRAGQLYVQTWHGDRMFKVCLHNSGKNGLPDVQAMDLGVIGSDQGEMFFRTAFKFPGELLRVGSPRNDALMHPCARDVSRIRAAIGLGAGEKVAMYAPTMREHLGHTSALQDLSAIDFVRVLDLLEARDHVKWRLIVRAHSTVAGLTGYARDERILDLTDYEDMRDLLEVCDLLMTDYSSSACDFPLTGRAVALYQPDIASYKARDRALYFEMADSPFWAAANQQDLEKILSEMTPSRVQENDQAILDFFGTTETGEAAKLVAQRIVSHIAQK
ncbi:MAG: CDP-glycerol glycerophosphotransferase family protein [Clostridia bacterium]